MAELADAHDSKSCEVTPHGSSTLPFGMVQYVMCRGGGIGRHVRFRVVCLNSVEVRVLSAAVSINKEDDVLCKERF